MEKNNGKIKGVLLMFTSAFLWGSSYVATKGATESFPPFLLVAIRMFIGSAIVALISLRQFRKLNKRIVFVGFVLGALYAAGMSMQTLGVKYTAAGRTAFLTSVNCVMMPFLEWIVLKNRPRINNVVAAVIGLVGVGFVALNGSFLINGGDVLTLVATFCFAVQIVLVGLYIRDMDAGLLNFFLLFSAGVFMIIVSLFVENMDVQVDGKTMFSVMYLSVACTGIPLLFQGIAQKYIAPTLVTIICCSQAVFASVLSAIIFQEEFTLRVIIGFVLIFAAVFISTMKTKNLPIIN